MVTYPTRWEAVAGGYIKAGEWYVGQAFPLPVGACGDDRGQEHNTRLMATSPELLDILDRIVNGAEAVYLPLELVEEARKLVARVVEGPGGVMVGPERVFRMTSTRPNLMPPKYLTCSQCGEDTLVLSRLVEAAAYWEGGCVNGHRVSVRR